VLGLHYDRLDTASAWLVSPGSPPPASWLGFTWEHRGGALVSTNHPFDREVPESGWGTSYFAAPHWALASVTAVAPLAWLRRTLGRRRRAHAPATAPVAATTCAPAPSGARSAG
jgi:hypothetical protein